MKPLFALALVLGLGFSTVARAEPTEPALSGAWTAGYDSRYVLYGYRLSRHLLHTDIYLHYPLSESLSLWGGSWFGYLPDGTYRELDGYVGLDYQLGDWLSVGAAYSIFYYIEAPFPTSDQAHEFAAHVTAATGGWTLSLREHYDTEADGHLIRGMVDYALPLTDRVGLNFGAEAGYSLYYFTQGNQWNHALGTITAPMALTGALSFSPYISRSIPLAAIKDFERYETVWGGAFSLGF
ncbi:MAG TPA: hypothetical protein PKE26_13090 [Kiritimatiellia bacterium]|nr:hypothetical protein [Kiritimatiellia bacterium]HMP00038.1 hypothetical protein [Kiritimatiellia bacterium]